MAIDKAVDSTQLDADLTTVADAIRAKGGTSAELSFPGGMAQAIADIPSGGITPTGTINITDTTLTDVTNYANAQVVDADLTAGNIKDGVNILGVLGTFTGGGGTPKINGAVYDCGEFTLATDTSSNYTVSHSLGVVPSAVFLWVVNPSYETRGIIGKYATDVSSVLNASVTAVNGALAAGTGSSAARMRTYKTADDITFCCDSTYPLVAGLRYQWLAIGTEVTV